MCERSALRKVFEDASIVPGHGVITVAIIIFDVYGAFDIINRVYDAVVPVTFAIRVTITSIVQPMALHPHPNFECTTLSGIFFLRHLRLLFFLRHLRGLFFLRHLRSSGAISTLPLGGCSLGFFCCN